MAKTLVKITERNGRIYIGDSLLYLVKCSNGDYRVYDDGEYEGKYCGSIATLKEMTEEEAVHYIWMGI